MTIRGWGRIICACCWIGTALGAVGLGAAENWTQFRGPQANGISRSRSLPVHWGEQSNVVWKTAIHGKGWSSPVIWSNQVWVTTATEDGRELSALCLDRITGKITRDLKLFEVAVPQEAHRFNSYASPTPVVEDDAVYVSFGSPGTARLDASTGKVVWERRDLECHHWRGAGSSPVLFLDRLLMHFDGADQQYVVALDKKTGKTLWKTRRTVDFKDLKPDGKPQDGGDWRKAFSTPSVMLDGNQFVVLSLGSKAFYAYDFASGRELWRTEEPTSHSGTVKPLFGRNLIFTTTGLPKGQLWALRTRTSGSNTTAQVVWKVARNVPTRPSPVLWGEHLYMVDDGGIATCLEADTGNEVWRERVGGNFSASLLAGAGHLYFMNEEGKTIVLAAEPRFKVVAQNQLDAGIMASPATYGRSLFIRTKTHLYRIEDRNPATSSPTSKP